MNDQNFNRPKAVVPPLNASLADDESWSEDPRVVAVVQEYLQELEAGQSPDRQAYVRRYPELSPVIAQCLEGLELVHPASARASYPTQAATAALQRNNPWSSPLGDFQIMHELARGGMGVVYEAVQLSLGRRVALKVLPFAATLESRQLQRFKIEAQAAALLHHTHIVPIHAVGCERGVHFYAMQLIEGQSLALVIRQLRAREGRVSRSKTPSASTLQQPASHHVAGGPASENGGGGPPWLEPGGRSQQSTVDISVAMTAGTSIASEAYVRRAARLMVQAAQALDHAHQAGVVHRDIKPANLLVDVGGNLWVTDFGLAQLQADNGLTRSGDLVGTFRYMSPEQTSGQRTMLDHRTDIYSLGATFYELLTLEPPLAGETHQELLYQILHEEPRGLRETNRAVPPELETIILKALSKSPADRYRTAGEMAADIQRYLDHQPILARRPSLWDRTKKWSRRHPAVAVAGLLVLLVMTIGALISNRLIAEEQRRTMQALDGQQLRAEEAEQRFQQARQAVDTLFQISEEELADKPLEVARRRILEVVLSHYQEFIEQRQGDPASQAELANMQAKVQGILRELNAIQNEMQMSLLANKVVQDDLQMTNDQAEQLESLLRKWYQEYQTDFAAAKNLSEEDRRSQFVATADSHERALKEVLSAEQLRRFRQITIQRRGLFAFKEPEIVRALGLTSEQRAAIRKVEREMFASFFSARFPPGSKPGGTPGGTVPGPPPLGRAAGRDQEEWVEKALAVLSVEQLLRWDELTGPSIEGLDEGGFGRGFPRPGP